MGDSRRKEAREIAETIDESNQRIVGLTLVHVCAAGIPVLKVACHCCQRKGSYRVTRLIDQYGPDMTLTGLKHVLAGNCSKIDSANFFNKCGCYFPGVPKK